MLDRTSIPFADVHPDTPPLLLVIVDTEEEFDWGRPLSRDNISVESTAEQHRAQEIFARHGVVPAYMVDYPVATAPKGCGLDAEALLRSCRGQLPSYMVPQHIIERDTLPRNPNGKIDRTALRVELEARLGKVEE